MSIVFFGNTKYSVIVAKALHSVFGLKIIVTIPDRILGRKKILTSSPTKQFAIEYNIPVVTFDKLDDHAVTSIKRSISGTPALRSAGVRTINDFAVVADYGLILPEELLRLPKYAPLNVHHSLLPKYRGPSPAPTAILSGDKISGVTIIRMTDRVDAGPILAQKEYELRPDETTGSLLTVLNTLGGEIVIEVIKNYQSITPIPQDESKASMTKRITKEDGYIDLENPPSPEKLDLMIRAYYPWPNVWTKYEVRNMKYEIIKFLPERKIQVGGGKPMGIKDFLNGYPQMKEIVQKLWK